MDTTVNGDGCCMIRTTDLEGSAAAAHINTTPSGLLPKMG